MVVSDFQIYKVGEKHPELAKKQDGAQVFFQDKHLVIIVYVYEPTRSQRRSANTVNNGLKLSLFRYDDIITIAIKPGNLDWHDAYTNPHFFDAASLPTEKIAEGYGLAATYIFVDSSCGLIHEMRTFALSNEFSNSLIDSLNFLKDNDFSVSDYLRHIANLQRRYTAAEIGRELRQSYFKLRGK